MNETLGKRSVTSYVSTILIIVTYVCGLIGMFIKASTSNYTITFIDNACQVIMLLLLVFIIYRKIWASVLYIPVCFYYSGLIGLIQNAVTTGNFYDITLILTFIYVAASFVSMFDIILYKGFKADNRPKSAEWYYGRKY